MRPETCRCPVTYLHRRCLLSICSVLAKSVRLRCLLYVLWKPAAPRGGGRAAGTAHGGRGAMHRDGCVLLLCGRRLFGAQYPGGVDACVMSCAAGAVCRRVC